MKRESEINGLKGLVEISNDAALHQKRAKLKGFIFLLVGVLLLAYLELFQSISRVWSTAFLLVLSGVLLAVGYNWFVTSTGMTFMSKYIDMNKVNTRLSELEAAERETL
ncbi:hypothetical protein GCM10008090_27630 [Arenicella chitinivorans]|uniref:Uncharacterized protein n=1 Tax=Arenicella chitinivorans TaxID=1329800 RepID=A0A918RYK0_9GAMM|nr:hypothetical protein [Arenicella chitinivorans]GHA16299.1 hypothetical protein GCM10008090_27630 [Arenicella chitinivorans]